MDASVDLSDRQADVLLQLFYGRSLRGIARELDLSPSTVHGHLRRLSEKGLVEKKGRRWQLTAEGVHECKNRLSEGSGNRYRTPPRTHNIRLQCEILDQPPRELLEERLPEGTGVSDMGYWEGFSNQVGLSVKDVTYQIGTQTVTFRVPEITDTPARAVERGILFAAKARRRLEEELGLRLSEPRYESGAEFAYPDHPVAWRLERDYGLPFELSEDRLWVDESKGSPELEAEGRRLASAIEQVNEEFVFEDGWLLEDWLPELKNACPDDLEKQIWDAPDWSVRSGTP